MPRILRAQRGLAGAALMIAVVATVVLFLSGNPFERDTQSIASNDSCTDQDVHYVDVDLEDTVNPGSRFSGTTRWSMRIAGDNYHAVRLDGSGAEEIQIDGDYYFRESSNDDWTMQSRPDYSIMDLCEPDPSDTGSSKSTIANFEHGGIFYSDEGDFDIDGITLRHYSSVADPDHVVEIPDGYLGVNSSTRKQLWVDHVGRVAQYRNDYTVLSLIPEDSYTAYSLATYSNYGEVNTILRPANQRQPR